MNENFLKVFEETLDKLELRPGSLLQARVLDVSKDYVKVDVGLKSDALIPTEEFATPEGGLSVNVGDEVPVILEAVENGYGETLVSREKAKRCEAWKRLEAAYSAGELVTGIISGRVKGGFTVDLNDIRAFLPGSLVDIRPLKDTTHLEGKPLEFKVLKLDQERNNVVVSRRAVLAQDQIEEREKLLKQLKEGLILKGIVKNLTDYGAFVDLGGIDGLLHITDMAWSRVRHPSEILNVGDELKVQVLKFDAERMRVSLGLKQLTEDPWDQIAAKYTKGMRVKGRVSNFIDYGGFVALEPGIEGLVHISEMDWTNKNIHPSKVFHIGEEVEVMILDIDHRRRRVSLGLKQCQENPWQHFAEKFAKGSIVDGEVSSITDFGIFLGLEGGIDGLVHLSDLSWDVPGEKAIKEYSKGQPVQAVVLQVDVARERVSLGVKQLSTSPAEQYFQAHPKGSVVSGEIFEVDVAKQVAKLSLAPSVIGEIPLNRLGQSVVPDALVGTTVEATVQEVCGLQGKGGPSIGLTVDVAGDGEEPSKASGPKPPVCPQEPPLSAMAEAFRLARSKDAEQ